MIRGLPGVLARIDELRALIDDPTGAAQPKAAAAPAQITTTATTPSPLGVTQPGQFGALLSRAIDAQSTTGAQSATGSEAAGVSWKTKYDDLVSRACERYGVDKRLVHAVIRAESNYNPRCVSHAGAMGLMQLMPENCKDYGVSDPFDPAQNIDGGVRHLKDMLDGQDTLALGLAAYNAGPGAVRRYGGIPPYRETQNYVNKITGWLAEG